MPNPIDLFSVNLPLHEIVLLGFYVCTGLYVIFSVVMYYHWNEYSTDTAVTRITTILYIVTTAPVIISIGLLTYYIY